MQQFNDQGPSAPTAPSTAPQSAGVVIPLTHPVETATGRYESLTMRRPILSDHLTLPTVDPDTLPPEAGVRPRRLNQEERSARLMARLCDVPLEVVEELDWFDYDAVKTVHNALVAADINGAPPMRRPSVRDFLQMEGVGTTDTEKEVALIALCTGISRTEVVAMDVRHYRGCQVRLCNFRSLLTP